MPLPRKIGTARAMLGRNVGPSSLRTGLIAGWKLDEANGNALDSVGANTLTPTASEPTSVAGKIGTARSFAVASSQYFTIADNAALSVGDISFTFDCWVKLTTGGTTRRFIAKGTGAALQTQYQYILQHNSSNALQWIVSASSSQAVVTSAALSLDTWYYVTAWHDADLDIIGIALNNGTPVTTSWALGSYDGAGNFYLGAGPGATVPIDGVLDDVFFWKKALTGSERAARYNGGAGNTHPF